MKLYAVTEGCYSCYSIITLQRDKKRAERIADFYHGYVEEYDEDDFSVEKLWWTVWICKNQRPEAGPNLYGEFKEKVIETQRSGECVYRVYLTAPDEAHALKKAQDMVAEYKAKKEGIT